MQERKRPMPVGIEDFKELIQNEYYFVDKTRFLKELLDSKGKITLITRPRRFGKTLNHADCGQSIRCGAFPAGGAGNLELRHRLLRQEGLAGTFRLLLKNSCLSAKMNDNR